MLSFFQWLNEQQQRKTIVFAFGRMNPPTTGHQALVDKVKQTAAQHNADHEIVLSHTQDSNKNPLSAEDKLRHAQTMFPNTNISVASKQQPTLIQHLTRLHKAGYTHAVIVGGSDRIPEYRKLIEKYNGHPDLFNFKKVSFVSAGERDPDAQDVSGMSASKMRSYAKQGNFDQFKQGVPKLGDSAQLYKDVRKGMELD